jgi:16S rRNA (guanine527-N7)-methyltransferase
MNFQTRMMTFLDLGFDSNSLTKLKDYIDLLWSSNEELNLISRQMSFAELLDNHIVDCLLPLQHFPSNLKNVADFGSGGGLPAVIYAIQFPNIQFHLYEKSPKKREFLEKCKVIAPNLHIHGEIPVKLTDIDLVTARGFKPLDVILDVSRDYFMNGGKYFLLKARKEKIDEEFALAKKKFKNLQVEVIPLKSPVLDVERHLVTI